MKNLLAISFILIVMNINSSIGSAISEPSENLEIKNKIFSNIDKDSLIPSLSLAEKEWLYEVDIISSLPSSITYESLENSQEISQKLSDLALFYRYKNRTDLEDKILKKQAEIDLSDAALGNENLSTTFKYLVQKGFLDNENLNRIQKFVNSDLELNDMAKKDFNNLIYILVEAYKKSNIKTLNLRAEKGINLMPLYESVINLCIKNLSKQAANISESNWQEKLKNLNLS